MTLRYSEDRLRRIMAAIDLGLAGRSESLWLLASLAQDIRAVEYANPILDAVAVEIDRISDGVRRMEIFDRQRLEFDLRCAFEFLEESQTARRQRAAGRK